MNVSVFRHEMFFYLPVLRSVISKYVLRDVLRIGPGDAGEVYFYTMRFGLVKSSHDPEVSG